MSLEVSQLTKFYGNQKALDEVSFSAAPGRILGFLGPNGAGKSTTMKIITGFLAADSGEVSVLGQDALHAPKKVSNLIGYLPEHNPLYLDMYVREFLEFSGGLYGISGAGLRSKVEEMLLRTGLKPEQHKKIGQLSKGYRQRVGLARALIHDPQVVILDEPTTGLDPNQLVEIRSLIQEVAQDKTLILSTHIMQEVEAICHDVVIINRGKILASDSLVNLKSGAAEAQLILEAEEELQVEWFEDLGRVSFGSKGKTELRIACQDAAVGRKGVMQVVHQRGLNLISLNQQQKNLEQIFREITK
ncbi:gliding motility-associated ABC transporter ATP-binding subunit GldA [Algoriphagus halophytocola]|uniref:Gliding motility-associated ABC transporter ATP-binding subunit GldA n=1 Tax=Algoriphagus halophytocola TaxID=2991499 RepID=A0ABY6ME61_9BACT|nr:MULTISPECIES: gliding motility-associated ABC transporter ATP-binding subunit GldA [unclassified Algoriphagus]UZD22056.1 gliding motility-associated ABC transporter ATP-binding subunit GldA [Algoriphagus sp. TR-M5]WBL43307.1 gliding motility-associated ABC transporter ATP-binding subunit GldA [Algoriphagus sp. TR-M9]